MSKVHMKDICLAGTKGGPVFKNIADLHVSNLTFIGGNIEGDALVVDGQSMQPKISLDEVLAYIREHLHQIPRENQEKIIKLLDGLSHDLDTNQTQQQQSGIIKNVLVTTRDLAIGTGANVLASYLDKFISG